MYNTITNTIPNDQRTKCHIWTRGMGYYRPTANFNIGKQSEFKERNFFNENVALNAISNKEV